jgi:hypothetical protein
MFHFCAPAGRATLRDEVIAADARFARSLRAVDRGLPDAVHARDGEVRPAALVRPIRALKTAPTVRWRARRSHVRREHRAPLAGAHALPEQTAVRVGVAAADARIGREARVPAGRTDRRIEPVRAPCDDVARRGRPGAPPSLFAIEPRATHCERIAPVRARAVRAGAASVRTRRVDRAARRAGVSIVGRRRLAQARSSVRTRNAVG